MRLGIGTGLVALGSRLRVGLQFTPQATGTVGNLTTNPSAANTIVDANLGLHEGFARVQGPRTRVDTGRFELNYGDALVLGNLDWNEVGRSFDGVGARIASSAVVVLARGLKLRGLNGVCVPNEGMYNDPVPAAPARAKGADPAHYLEVELRYDRLP